MSVTVDLSAIQDLGREIERARRVMLGRLAERGYQILRSEVPVDTGNLKQGVAPADVDYESGVATLTVSARSGRTGGTATIYGADGQAKKTVSLKPQKAFNYAAAVVKGHAAQSGKAFLIPVAAAPAGQGYLVAGGKTYIVRTKIGAVAPNPFDERSAARLEREAVGIGEAVLGEIFG